MMPFGFVLAGAGLFLTVAEAVPAFDVRPTCRAAVEMMGNQGRTVESCMASETVARDEIAKGWPSVPKEEKTRCMATAVHAGSPSYVELLICIEMHRDSRARQEELKADRAKAKLQKPLSKP
jgi:hypothetical protein